MCKIYICKILRLRMSAWKIKEKLCTHYLTPIVRYAQETYSTKRTYEKNDQPLKKVIRKIYR